MDMTAAHPRLVFILSANLTEGRIGDGTGEGVIFAHTGNIQVFKNDRLKGGRNRRGRLVDGVATDVRHAPMQSRQAGTTLLHASARLGSTLFACFLLSAD